MGDLPCRAGASPPPRPASYGVRSVLIGSILPRSSSRITRGRLRSASKSLHTQHQRARIDAAARGDVRAQCLRVPRHARDERRRLRLQRLDDAADDRNGGGADLLALVAGHAMENAGARERSADLERIVARIERGLAELDQRRRAGEIGEIAEADHRAGRVAAHAADAVERLRGVLHVLVRERLRESPHRGRAARSRARARRPCARTDRGRPRGRARPAGCAAARSSSAARPPPSMPALRGR